MCLELVSYSLKDVKVLENYYLDFMIDSTRSLLSQVIEILVNGRSREMVLTNIMTI